MLTVPAYQIVTRIESRAQNHRQHRQEPVFTKLGRGGQAALPHVEPDGN